MKWLAPASRGMRVAAMLGVAALAACSYRTGFNDYPLTRSLTWFNYTSAQDIRTQCAPGRDVYRIIYNGNWQEQARTYELRPSATGAGGVLDQRVFAGGAGLTFVIPIVIPLDDPLAPARAADAQTRLTDADYRGLVAALHADGLGQAGPASARLNSWEFWWAAAACVNGTFLYNAWIYPTERFRALRFPTLLLRQDQTGVPVNQPRRTAPHNPNQDASTDPTGSDFTIQLDRNGLPIRLPAL